MTIITAPTVTSVSPSSGFVGGGQTIIVNGAGFVPGMAVSIGGLAATSVTVASASRLTCTVPRFPVRGAYALYVVTPGGVSNRIAAAYTATLDTRMLGWLDPRQLGLDQSLLVADGANATGGVAFSAVEGERPALIGIGTGIVPGMAFAGAQRIAASFSPMLGGAVAGATLIIVGALATGSSLGVLATLASSADANSRIEFAYNGSGPDLRITRFDAAGGSDVLTFSSPGTAPFVWSAVVDPAHGLLIRRDGVTVASSAPPFSGGSSGALSSFILGGHSSTEDAAHGRAFFNGSIGHAMAFAAALTGSDLAYYEQFLQRLSGI